MTPRFDFKDFENFKNKVKVDYANKKYIIHIKDMDFYTQITGMKEDGEKKTLRIYGICTEEYIKKSAEDYKFTSWSAYYFHYERDPKEYKSWGGVPKLDVKITSFNGKINYTFENKSVLTKDHIKQINDKNNDDAVGKVIYDRSDNERREIEYQEKIRNRGLRRNNKEYIKAYRKYNSDTTIISKKEISDEPIEIKEFKNKFIEFLEDNGFVKVKRPKVSGSKEYTKIIRLGKDKKNVMVSFRILNDTVEYRIDNKLESVLSYNVPEILRKNNIEDILHFFKKNGKSTNPPKYE